MIRLDLRKVLGKTMKINDIILKEGLWDSMRSAAFNLTGGKAGGGITGEAQRIFVTNFILLT